MMATVPHVTSGLGLRKFQADGLLLTRVYTYACVCVFSTYPCTLSAYRSKCDLPAVQFCTLLHISLRSTDNPVPSTLYRTLHVRRLKIFVYIKRFVFS